LFELLLAYIAPRANCIGNNFDIEFCHFTESWSEHIKMKDKRSGWVNVVLASTNTEEIDSRSK